MECFKRDGGKQLFLPGKNNEFWNVLRGMEIHKGNNCPTSSLLTALPLNLLFEFKDDGNAQQS